MFKELRTLTVNTTGQGSIDVNPKMPLYLDGDRVRLRAFPDPGWHFAGWRGDLNNGNATSSISSFTRMQR